MLRIRGEMAVLGDRRPEQSIRIGLTSEFKTRASARAEATRRMTLLGMGDRHHGRRMRLADYLAGYLAGTIATKRKSTRAAFASYGRHLERELGSHFLDQMTIGVVQAMIAKLLKRNLNYSTIHSIVSLLRRLTRSARAEGVAAIVIGPRELSFPRESRAPTVERSFTIDETRRILSNATWPWKALYALQAYLALRAGESLAVTWPQIDFEAKLVRIDRQAAHGQIAATKSRNSAAPLPMPAGLARLLHEYRAHWIPNDRQLLVANKQGNPLWAGGVLRNHLQPLLRRLGIAPAGFHAWRHALASEAFRAGAGAAAVKQLLRHGSINTTLKYATVAFDDLVRSSNAVARLIDAPSEETQGCGDANAANAAIIDVSEARALQPISESTHGGKPC